MGYKESFDFFKDMGDEQIDVNRALETYVELMKREQGTAERAAVRQPEEFNMENEWLNRAKGNQDELVIGRDLKGLDFQMARCCNPVYGDQVFGFVTVSGGIKIHRIGCPNAQHCVNALVIALSRHVGPAKVTTPILLPYTW